jgi:hypothetical protein
MANTSQLSSRRFAQHHTFPLITFDMLVHTHVATSIYVHCKVCLVDDAQLAIVSRENLALQVRVITL